MKVSVLHWIPIILHILTCIFIYSASSLCLENQRSLLLQLKTSISYNVSASHKLSTWDNQPSDCCKWTGVLCNTSSGYVTGLDLCGEYIHDIGGGGFESLSRFEHLQSLNLANNSFSTSTGIPAGFGKLTGLTYLNLSKAGFSGQIPVEISSLVNLVTLDLSAGSYLSGFPALTLENPGLGVIIRNFSKLEGLYLNEVVISASGSEWGKALSGSVPNLKFLSLIGCNLSGGIDKSLEKLNSLSEIQLDQNNNIADVVPDFIGGFRNLTLLTLKSCNLTGIFPRKILELPTLQNLDLTYNKFLRGTLPEFPVGASLQSLVLSYTNFSGNFPKSVGNLSRLQTIKLRNCSFSGSIPSVIGKFNQLEYVDFSFNNFSGQIPSFSSAKNLVSLCLSNNLLNGTITSTNWSSLSKLTDLDLSANLLEGNIPMEIFSLRSLQTALLFQNKFNGNLREFPNNPSLKLDTLDLSSNYLKGSLPKSLFELKSLGVLKLSTNNFSGDLNLNVIQQLKNLSTLELSFNSLSIEANDKVDYVTFPQLSNLNLASCKLSSLPDFLKTQSKLVQLDLSINNISGIIPKWVWSVGNGSLSYLNLSCNSITGIPQPLPGESNIYIFDIHGNKIQGQVPTMSSPRVIYLDYSNNNFTSISPDIGKFIQYTVYLSFSRNSISHEIPTTLCNGTSLEVLDLSSNSMHGNIPQCIITMTSSLKVLNLRNNTLSSAIIDKFPEECSLSTLNLGYNHLQGQIPRSLAYCTQLEVLDLGRNLLNDKFPQHLRNMSNLRVLVLRSNNFYGPISCPNNSISWPLLQILDIASNHFNGELNATCFADFKALMTEQPQSDTSLLRVPIIPTNNIYYQDTVLVSTKNEEINLQKILTLFKCVDISSNNFHGEIPTTIGYLATLIFLNVSHNALSGHIPSTIGNLTSLESLDLSYNHLTGKIPPEISELNFLSLLNLSYNKLTGSIPSGTQLQTFDRTAYIGNPGLCGTPLPKKCSSPPEKTMSTPPAGKNASNDDEHGFDWQFILIGAGFGTGLAVATSPIIFWKKGRKWHDKQVEKLVSLIRSGDGVDQGPLDDILNEAVGHQLFDFTSFDVVHDIGDDETRFCLFCSKLDGYRGEKVRHDPKCSCHMTTAMTSPSSPPFSE